jgi:arylsulfatase
LPRPNLLFLFTDEQRADTMAAYGNSRIEMPNLNRLAEQSVVFDRAYVTQPVCTPSRSTIMTGLWPHTNGCTANNIALREDTPCLSEMLCDDYATAYHGKWHLGDEICQQHGFDEWISIDDLYAPHYSPGRDAAARCDYHHFLVENGIAPKDGSTFSRGEGARLPEEFSKPAFLAREASRYIREHQRDPFCLFVNFLEPHMPFFGPRDDQYDPADVTLPVNFDHPPTDDQPLKTRAFAHAYYERGYERLPLRTEADWRRKIANYWGLCSLVDTHVGTILDTLEDTALLDNTIVVYTSEHGDMMGSHRLLAKCTMFEEDIRVPLMLRLPGQTGSRRVCGPVSQIDLVPTLLDLMDQPTPDHLQGKSLRPQLEGSTEATDDVFVEWSGPNTGILGEGKTSYPVPEAMADTVTPEQLAASINDPVRTIITPDGWKYNRSTIGEDELYDRNTDPGETTNLAPRAEHTPLIADLRDRIAAWQDRTGDSAAS